VHGSGAVTSDPAGIDCPSSCAARFDDQSLARLTATPAAGFMVSSISGACTGSPCAARMTADAAVDVTFAPIPRTLTVVVTGDGTGKVTSTPAGIDCPGHCSAVFPNGTPIALSAAPDAISRLAQWGGACGGPACAFIIAEDAHVEARIDRRRYVVQDLGTLADSYWSSPNAMSRHGGLVAGGSGGQVFLYDGIMHATSVQGDGLGVNDHGVVVGVFGLPSNFKGYRWSNGTLTELPSLGGTLTFAQAINNANVVTGFSSRADGHVRAVYWSTGPAVDLGSLGGGGSDCSYAYGINDDGIVVGESCVDGAGTHAVRFRKPGVIDDLGTLGGFYGRARAISGSGIIVGESAAHSNDPSHGFVWRDGTMTDVGVLQGTDQTALFSVNNQGLAVGVADVSTGGTFRGILYGAGRLLDLNALVEPTPYTITIAVGIDEAGNIAAQAYDFATWGQRAVILRPE
ncbi:MAG: hypothetical protein LC689_08770, partial [Myxococcales bacterium]|nr:hypothetical protein [Myxococcales bacterium]